MRSSLARELSSCCQAEALRSAATLAFNRSFRSTTCMWAWAKAAARSLQARARSCWTSPMTSELAGIPLGKPGALSIESGSSLGLLMLVGHGRELVGVGQPLGMLMTAVNRHRRLRCQLCQLHRCQREWTWRSQGQPAQIERKWRAVKRPARMERWLCSRGPRHPVKQLD